MLVMVLKQVLRHISENTLQVKNECKMYLEMHNNSVFEIVYLKTDEHDREKDSNLFVACYFAGRTQYFASV